MNPIVNQALSFPDFHGALPGGRSMQVEQTRAGSLSQKNSTDLTITTDEGDTVTLSLASATEVNAGIYRHGSYQAGRTSFSRTSFFQSSSSQHMAIEVNGDLNEEELKDIRAAVKTIGGMIDNFLGGDLQEMAKGGELLKELESISSLEAAFSYERQVVYGEQEKVEINSVVLKKGHHGHDRLDRLMKRIDRLTEEMAEQVKGFSGRRKHLTRSINDLFGRYRSGNKGNEAAERLDREVIQTVQSAFFQKIQTLEESGSFNLTFTT